LQAAALQDVLKTLAGKWPLVEIIIYPCTVQGSEAASAIDQALRVAISRNESEVILLVRGGGSLEDLSPFNDENLARTIASSHIPIISGIGHETDFSIADFVADIRASTPTAAAQIAVPESVEVFGQISSSRSRIETLLHHTLYQRMQHLDGLTRRVTNPVNAIAQHRNNLIQLTQRIMFSHSNIQTRLQQRIDKLIFRFYVSTPAIASHNREVLTHFKAITISFKSSFERRRVSLHTLMESLNQLNPEQILSRGYCIARTIEGNVIKEAKSLAPGQQISIQVRDGNILGTIDQVALRS
jgi:exodeoxyribonuclease VII large subunit